MTGAPEYRQPLPEELEPAGRLMSEAFVCPRPWGAGITTAAEPSTLRVLCEEGKVVAAAVVHPWRQYFGGRSIAASGPGAVAVASEARGRGVATRLLRHILDEGRANGVPLSVLYPASRQLYGKAGYAPGGWRITRLFEAAKIGARRGPFPVRRATPEDHAAIPDVHRQAAERTNGWLARPDYKWHSLLSSTGDEMRTAWVVEQDGALTGYLVTSVVHRGDRRLVRIDDHAAVTREAAQSLLAFLAGHAFQSHGILWGGGPFDALEASLAEATHQIVTENRMEWFLRLADVPAALELRGYPCSICQ